MLNAVLPHDVFGVRFFLGAMASFPVAWHLALECPISRLRLHSLVIAIIITLDNYREDVVEAIDDKKGLEKEPSVNSMPIWMRWLRHV